MKTNFIFLFFLIVFSHILKGQTGILTGKVYDFEGKPIENVNISYQNFGTTTNALGEYSLNLPSGKSLKVTYSHLSYNEHKKNLKIAKGKTLHYSPKLKIKTEKIGEVVIKDERADSQGITTLNNETVKNIPGANPGVESILKTLPGVSFNNELSTQYNVRGGNFEENLVYVNGIEVYRPFLIRSGQQEGLSFVNPNLTSNVAFSSGGFQAKFGDKLSSVLDITYRKPAKFGVALEASLIGASATVEGTSKDNKFKAILGARYRNNSLFVNTKDINSNFNPNFTDIQAYLSYQFTNKFSLDFLGNFALNNYNFTPVSRQTNFGTLSNPLALLVNYKGNEEDVYNTIFGAISGIYKVHENLSVSLTTSSYNTREQEYFDILAFYGIGEVDANLGSNNIGEISFIQNIGSQLDHARNNLDARIFNVSLKSTYTKEDDLFEFGIKYQFEAIKDQVIEWQVIDSAGFSLRPSYLLPKNDQPYSPYSTPIVAFQNIRAKNNINTSRLSGFIQWSRKSLWKDHMVWYNLGIRSQQWTISGVGINTESQIVFSPRGQFSIKPNWDKDMLFRISGGLYHQPPFYRELRDSLGRVHPEVKAQQSIHLVLGNDYSFKMWDRSFKLVSEAYYKKLTDVNPFTIDNVRLRYKAKNNAVAYATGFDIRLNGEFVPGTESWFSFGYLLTKENIENRGYISRPTDQRLKFAILFQDYAPNIPKLKMYLNLVYNTGVPGGSPSYADPYLFQNRLKDYFRSDVGISYVFVDAKNLAKNKWQQKFKELSAGIELFNMFDVQNSITNNWITDVSSNRSVAVPNYLSGRVLNVKIAMRF